MEEKKSKTFVLCDSRSVNSYGFRIDVDGIDTARFEANPVMLDSHDPERLIGRWENIRKEDGRLLADAVFDLDDEAAKKVAGRVERGFLKGCSVGVIIRELAELDGTAVATRTELMEASLCAIPADAGAVALYDENRRKLNYEDIKHQLKFNINMDKQEKKDEQTLLEQQQQLAAKDQRIAELEQRLADRDKEAVTAFLATAVAEGRIAEAEKEGFAKLAATDFDTVKDIIAKREAKPTASLHEMARHAAATAPADDRRNWNYLEWMKKDPEGLRKMKAEEPERFKMLQQTLKP